MLEEKKPMPEREEIVEIMYNKGLRAFTDYVVEVLYSKDGAKRYVVTEDENGLFRYCLEELYCFDEDEWVYMCNEEDALPAMWEISYGAHLNSIFDTREHALSEIYAEPEYKEYFI